jgi:hypothetical protein
MRRSRRVLVERDEYANRDEHQQGEGRTNNLEQQPHRDYTWSSTERDVGAQGRPDQVPEVIEARAASCNALVRARFNVKICSA